MSKLEEIKERIKQKKLLREQDGNNFPEKPIEVFKEEPKEVLRDNAYKIYCFNCRSKVTPLNAVKTKKEIKKGSFRNFLSGKCPNCKRTIVGVVKS